MSGLSNLPSRRDDVVLGADRLEVAGVDVPDAAVVGHLEDVHFDLASASSRPALLEAVEGVIAAAVAGEQDASCRPTSTSTTMLERL